MVEWPAFTPAIAGTRIATPLSANAFWDLYFNDAFVRLVRKDERWTGLATTSGHGLGLRDALRPASAEPIDIAMDTLRQYDDAADPRFQLLGTIETSTDSASLAIVQGQYPYRSAAPFSPQRMSAVMTELRGAVQPEALSARPLVLTVSSLTRWLSMALTAPGALTDQRITAAVWFLGERRDPLGAGVLVDLLDRANKGGSLPAQVSSSATDAAYGALWKIADGATLETLAAQMERSSETARWKYARLFERLLSADTLLSSDQLGDNYARPATWATLIAREHLAEPQAWKRHQSRALRWELRALAAHRLSAEDDDLRKRLASDEVGAVRRAAARAKR